MSEETRLFDEKGQFTRPVIKGYPELRWTGKRPAASEQYYPAQLRERYGEEKDGWINKIYWGDNLQVINHLIKYYRGKINLVYIDPPFDSRADYKMTITLHGETVSSDLSSFEEKQYGDIWTNDEYLQYIFERLILIKELLSDQGTIYVHCDWHKSHHIRLLMDEIFGPEKFQNEIIWQKIRTTKAQTTGFGNVLDHILVYTKAETCIFHKIYKEFDKNYIQTHYKEDKDGRLYRTVSMLQRGKGDAKKFGDKLLTPPQDMHWIWSQDRINEALKNGRIKFTSNGRPEKVQYLDEMKGDIVDDLWNDIPPLNSQAAESTQYPTQKPEQLLERIISSSSNIGDIILDCFMGSGTTQAVAMKLGRRFIGADINLGAVQTTTKRLISVANELASKNTNAQQQTLDFDNDESGSEESKGVFYTGFEVYNVNNYDFFKNPVEARDLLIQALEIQPFQQGNIWDGELDGRMVKILPVNRIATKADLEELKSNLPYKTYENRVAENPGQPAEKITLVCMGHEPDLKAALVNDLSKYKLDVEIVDILRDKADLQLKREAEAEVVREGDKLIIRAFYPMNLMQKLSLQKEYVEDWRQLVESVMIDWNFDGAVLQPAFIDIPDKSELVKGIYDIPQDAGTIKIKITDLLSESLEVEVR